MSENINEELQQVKTKGNRKYLTFLATEDMVKLKIPNTCPTRLQTKVSRIQLEKGKEPSEYEAPKQVRVGASGIFKRLGALEVSMKDENSDLWSRIKANNRAMMIGYFSRDVENKLAINSKQVINQIESKIDGRLTILGSSIDGIERRVRGLNGVKSDITQLSDLIASKVSREDVQSLILQDEENIIQRVKSNLDGRELISSINLDKSGVRIKGELITLDGSAYITNGIIENSHIKNATITSSKIKSISASKINTGTLDASKINVINLNANNITSGAISADRLSAGTISGTNGDWNLNTGKFHNGNYSEKIELYNGIFTSSESGNRRIQIDKTGINFFHGGGAKLGYLGRSVWTGTKNTNLDLKHDYNTSMGISYVDRLNPSNYNSYVVYDMHNRSGLLHSSGAAISRMGYPIMHMEGTYIKKKLLVDDEATFSGYIQARNGATFSGDIRMSGHRKINWGNGQICIENISRGLFIGKNEDNRRSGLIFQSDGKVVPIINGITGASIN